MTLVDDLARAVDLWKAGDLTEAERIARILLGAHPGHPAVLAVLVLVFQSRGESEGALKLARRAIAGAALSADLHHNAGVILTSLGRLDEAAPYFQQAAVLDPTLAPQPMRPLWRAAADGGLDFDLGFVVDDAHARAARLIPLRLSPPRPAPPGTDPAIRQVPPCPTPFSSSTSERHSPPISTTPLPRPDCSTGATSS